jgi:hypothetical protein
MLRVRPEEGRLADPHERDPPPDPFELLHALGHEHGGHVRIGRGPLLPCWFQRFESPAEVAEVAVVPPGFEVCAGSAFA